MSKLTGRLTAAVSALAMAAGLAAALTAPAGATTLQCLSAYGKQCGTFAGADSTNTTPVYWDQRGQNGATSAPTIGYGSNSPLDPATDYVKVEHIGTPPGTALPATTISYSFVYTPSGTWTLMCLSDPNAGSQAIVLRPCNRLQWQRFLARPVTGGVVGATPVYISNVSALTFAFQNVATDGYLIDAAPVLAAGAVDTRQLNGGGALTGGTTATPNEQWHYVP